MASFIPFFSLSITSKPDRVPTADEKNMVNKTPFHPMRPPIIANSFMSPPPIPSFLVKK